MKCEKCGNKLVVGEKFLMCGGCGFTKIKEEKGNVLDDYFYKYAFDNYHSVLAHEYHRLYELIKDEKYYGALLQLKDVLEVMLKFPVLIVVNDIWSKEEPTEKEKEIIKDMLKILSLGHWKNVAGKIIDNYKNDDLINVIEIISEVYYIYNKNEIVGWRNSQIGHGALSFDLEENFINDIQGILKDIKKHFEKHKGNYENLILFNGNNKKLMGYKEGRVLLDNREYLYIRSKRDMKISLFPFIIVNKNTPKLFDSYNIWNSESYILDYINGDKSKEKNISKIFKEKISFYNIDSLSGSNINSEIFSSEELEILSSLAEDSKDLVNPNYIVDNIKKFIEENNKGIFLLQMERGMGKTTLCKALDNIRMNDIKISKTEIRGYYIDDVIGYKLGRFQDEVTDTLKRKSKKSNEIFKITFDSSFLNKPYKGQALADVLNRFHEAYKSNLGKEKFCFIIDGLDEIRKDDNGSIFEYIPLKDYLNEGVYVILTSRTNEEIEKENKAFIGDNIKDIEKRVSGHSLRIYRDSEENCCVLKGYLKKNSKIANDKLCNLILEKGESRFLYIKALKELVVSLEDFDIEEINNNELIINQYLNILKERCGSEKYYKGIEKLIVVIALLEEPATLEEISYLYGDTQSSLKLVANIIDLRGLLKVERSNRGNLISIHNQWKKQILENSCELAEDIVNKWYKDIMSTIKEGKINPKGNSGESYLVSYIYDYVKIYSKMDITDSDEKNFIIYLGLYVENYNYNGAYIYEILRCIRIYSKVIEIRKILKEKYNLVNLNGLQIVHIKRATLYKSLGRYTEALEDYKVSKEIVENIKEKNKLVNQMELATIHSNCANVYQSLGRHEEALEGYNSSIEILRKLKVKCKLSSLKGLASIHMNRGNLYESLGRREEALEDYKISIEILKGLKGKGNPENLILLGMIHMNRGTLYHSLQRYNEALDDYKLSIKIMRNLNEKGKLENKNRLAVAYMNIGISYEALEMYDEALEGYKLSIEMLKDLNEKGMLGNKNELATAHISRGNAYRSLGKYKDALEDYNIAIEIIQDLNSKDRLGIQSDLALAYLQRGNLYNQYLDRANDALDDYKVAIEIIGKNEGEFSLKEVSYLDSIYTNRGILYKSLGRYNEALEDYNIAIEMKKVSNENDKLFNQNYLVEAYYSRAELKQSLERYEEALEDYNGLIEIMKKLKEKGKLDDLSDLAGCYNNRGYLYGILKDEKKALDDLKKALDYYKMLIFSENSLYQEAYINTLRTLIYVCLSTQNGNINEILDKYYEPIKNKITDKEFLAEIKAIQG